MSSSFITCTLNGSIGNQLFQIAHAFSLSKELGLELCLSFNQFSGCGQGSHPTKYYSSLYSKLNFVNKLLPSSISVEERFFTYNPKLETELKTFINGNKNAGIIVSGNYQSELYFYKHRDEVKKLFTPEKGIETYLKTFYPELSVKFNELFSKQNVDERCYIGIRRGDYMQNENYHLPCHLEYYVEAIKTIGDDKVFYIATDDIAWCKANFKGENFRFFQIADDLPQMLFGTLFKYYIISNSAFHWWASYLSDYENKRVIVPDKWINQYGYESIYREDMQILKR